MVMSVINIGDVNISQNTKILDFSDPKASINKMNTTHFSFAIRYSK